MTLKDDIDPIINKLFLLGASGTGTTLDIAIRHAKDMTAILDMLVQIGCKSHKVVYDPSTMQPSDIQFKYGGWQLRFKLKTDNMSKKVLTPDEARKLTNDSQAFFDGCMNRCFDAIRIAAAQGNNKVYLPSIANYNVAKKVKEELTLLGYRIGWWDSNTSNDTIHW